MHIVRSRLLILLVLVSVASAVVCSTARAGKAASAPTAVASSLGAAKPGVTPASGEPDVGLVPKPVTPGRMILSRPEGAFAISWPERLRLVLRMWMMRYLGAS